MSISEANQKLNTINTNYRQQIVDQNATSYETSLLYSKDNAFIEFLENDICYSIDNYKIALGKIEPPSNYTITRDDLSALRSAINTGIGHLGTYPNTILQKSKEVFEEYNEKFNALKSLYENNSSSASKMISMAIDAQNKRDNPPEFTKKNSLNQVVTDYAEIGSYRNEWSNKRDQYLSQASGYIDFMNTHIEKMKEVLEKGLKKV